MTTFGTLSTENKFGINTPDKTKTIDYISMENENKTHVQFIFAGPAQSSPVR